MRKLCVLGAVACALGFLASCQAALVSGIDPANMDPSVRIQDDLYLAVNGKWLAKTEIPADKSNYGAFTALDDLSRERIRALIEELAATPQPEGSEGRKIADLYRSVMDEKRIEACGLAPLEAELDKIEALATPEDLARYFGYSVALGGGAPFVPYVGQDEKDSTRYLVTLAQAGTGMPDRDYYLGDDPRFAEARKAYAAYVGRMLRLAGEEEAAAQEAARAILELETRFARAQWTKVELRDPEKNYHTMDMSGLSALAPGFAWARFFEGWGAPPLAELSVGQPPFITAADAIVRETPMAVWKKYLRFHALDACAIALPGEFQKAHFELHGKTLAGIPEDLPRWKKAVHLISGAGAGDFGVLGDALGKRYVAKYFPPEAKARMDRMVKNLLTAFDQGITELAWMTTETKARAREKLGKCVAKIGYTEKWRDYSALKISPDDLLGNVLASARLEHARSLAKLGKPIDRTEWGMTPQTVNAYFNPSMNEIVFPAAILQPPFFNLAADDAVNYGGIGAVIGHEASHGFDDQGSKYDGDGNLKNWWSEKDREAFDALAAKLVAQYDAYEPLPGKHLNGTLTLGENIADLSGLAVAYKAYRLSLEGRAVPVIDGLTGDQRFFMGWAQVWARKYREPELVKRLLTDPHSPSQYRGNGPVMNSTSFAKAFGLRPGDKLYKPENERIVIW
jgi:putative endopeptidase